MLVSNSKGENIIFLISQPRAGSTLLQLVLAGHPDIATTSEPWIALHPIYALKHNEANATYNSDLAYYALLDFLSQAGVDKGFYKQQLNAFLLSLYQQAIKYQNKKKFLDKTPRYYLIIPELIEIFPKAKFIILIRNPLAVLNSILKTWVKNDWFSLENFKNDLLVAPAKLVDSVKQYPDVCLPVKYEDFAADPKTTLESICKFLGISYLANMLDYGVRLNPEWKFGDSVGIYKASRPFTGSLDAWQRDLKSPQANLIALSYLEALGEALIRDMGYDYQEIKSLLAPVTTDGLPGNLIRWQTIMSNAELLTKAQQEVKTLLAEKSALLNSWSWRVTDPARAVYRWLTRK